MMKKLAVIGSGYVGLASAVGFAEFGCSVRCIDIDEERIDSLARGEVPFYEPDLHKKMHNNIQRGTIAFSTRIDEAVKWADVVIIAVGTPQLPGGSADLSYIYSAAETIGQSMDSYKIIVTKSTVPVGTNERIKKIIEEHNRSGCDFDIVSNPEFLQEGRAMVDFMNPDRVVIGTEHQRPVETMKKIMAPLHDKGVPFFYTDLKTAEMIKYGANCFLAMKVAYVNEMARLCDAYGIDVREVAAAVGKDSRIGGKYLNPGPGYGGSCLPKDTQAIASAARELQVDMPLLDAVIQSNQMQKDYVVQKIRQYFGSAELDGRTIAVLGLAFKPETDDIREAPAVHIIGKLLSLGAQIRAYDPKAMDKARILWRDKITLCADVKEAVAGADMTLILTEWSVFRDLDPLQLKKLMGGRGFFDTRDIYKRQHIEAADLDYLGIGR